MTDPIADMLTRVRNANKALHAQVEMPASRMKIELARLLRTRATSPSYSRSRPGSIGDVIVVDAEVRQDRGA